MQGNEKNKAADEHWTSHWPIVVFGLLLAWAVGLIAKQIEHGGQVFFQPTGGFIEFLTALPVRSFGLVSAVLLFIGLMQLAVLKWIGRHADHGPRRAVGLCLLLLGVSAFFAVLSHGAETWGGRFGANIAQALTILPYPLALLLAFALVAYGVFMARDWFFFSRVQEWLGSGSASPAFALGMGRNNQESGTDAPPAESFSSGVAVVEKKKKKDKKSKTSRYDLDEIVDDSTLDRRDSFPDLDLDMPEELEDDVRPVNRPDLEASPIPDLGAAANAADLTEDSRAADAADEDLTPETPEPSEDLTRGDTAEIPIQKMEAETEQAAALEEALDLADNVDSGLHNFLAEEQPAEEVVAESVPSEKVRTWMPTKPEESEVGDEEGLSFGFDGSISELDITPDIDFAFGEEALEDEESTSIPTIGVTRTQGAVSTEEDGAEVTEAPAPFESSLEFDDDDFASAPEAGVSALETPIDVEMDEDLAEYEAELQGDDEEGLRETFGDEIAAGIETAVEEEDTELEGEDEELEDEEGIEYEADDEEEDFDEEDEDGIEYEVDEDEEDEEEGVEYEYDEEDDDDVEYEDEDEFEDEEDAEELEDDAVEYALDEDEDELESEEELAQEEPVEYAADDVTEEEEFEDEEDEGEIALESEDADSEALSDDDHEAEELEDAIEALEGGDDFDFSDDSFEETAPVESSSEEAAPIVEHQGEFDDLVGGESAAASVEADDETWGSWLDEKPAAGPGLETPAAAGPEIEDDTYRRAVRTCLEEQNCSVSVLQRQLKLPFRTAAACIDRMEAEGLVGPYRGTGTREIRISLEEWEATPS